jgi:hypothetical protein
MGGVHMFAWFRACRHRNLDFMGHLRCEQRLPKRHWHRTSVQTELAFGATVLRGYDRGLFPAWRTRLSTSALRV